MGVAVYTRTNESRAVAYAAAPVSHNVINDALPADEGLSMGVVANSKINEAQSAVIAASIAAAATENSQVEAATLNLPAIAATAYALTAADTSNAPAAETPQLRRRFSYSKQILMSDKELFWHQHENIPPNVIGMFENDIMCGRVVYVTRPSANKFGFIIK